MSLLRDSAADNERLVRYLLGLLPVDETDRLDEQSIVDDDFANRLRLAEDDLVDAYVSGTLSADWRQRFESHYMASPRRRAKVAFAARLLSAVDRAAPAEPVRSMTEWTGPTRFAPVAIAVAAALLLTTGVLLVGNVRLSRQARAAGAREATAASRVQALTHELAQQQAAASAARQTLADAHATQAAQAERAASGLALVLLPETRGVGHVPAVALEPGLSAVPLYLRVEPAGDSSYEVTLKDPETNRIVWRDRAARADHKARADDAERTAQTERSALVSVRVPARLLNPQHYSLDLFAVRADGRAEFVATYAFEVVRR